jgi:hypothetical protein
LLPGICGVKGFVTSFATETPKAEVLQTVLESMGNQGPKFKKIWKDSKNLTVKAEYLNKKGQKELIISCIIKELTGKYSLVKFTRELGVPFIFDSVYTAIFKDISFLISKE